MTEPFRYDHGAAKTTVVVYAEPTGVKSVTAWAVVDKDGEYTDLEMYGTELDGRSDAHWRDDVFPARAPHHVIRVQITPIPEPSPGPGPSTTAYDESGFAHER